MIENSINLPQHKASFSGVFLGMAQEGVVKYSEGGSPVYLQTDEVVFSARRLDSLLGIFFSRPIDGGADLIRWTELLWSATIPQDSFVWVFVRSAPTLADLETKDWSGPFLNQGSNDIHSFQDRYLQVRLILSGAGYPNGTGITPVINSVSVQGIQPGNEEKFYTKAFDLGFIPSHILVTYNGRIPEDTVLRIAVAGKDTIAAESYVQIEPNRVESLLDLPDFAGQVKLVFSAFGNKMLPFELNKIGIFVSGDRQRLLNEANTPFYGNP
jgi:hypothetical protein